MPRPGDNGCYIIILPEKDNQEATDSNAAITISFDTMPTTITDAKQAVWQDTAIIARSAPLKTYQFSGARTITFSLDFFISIEANDIPEGQEKDRLVAMKKKLNALRGLMYPNNSNTIRRPRKCIIRIGDAFGMLAFCKNVSVIYRGDSPWNLKPTLAHHATVNLVLEETGEKIYTFDDVYADKELNDIVSEESGVSSGVVTTQSFYNQLTETQLDELVRNSGV